MFLCFELVRLRQVNSVEAGVAVTGVLLVGEVVGEVGVPVDVSGLYPLTFVMTQKTKMRIEIGLGA